MSDTDNQTITLLEEIRNLLKAQSKLMEDSRANNSDIRDQSSKQLEQYQQMMDTYKASQDTYQQNLPKKVALPAIFLGIIAVSLVVGLVLRIMGI